MVYLSTCNIRLINTRVYTIIEDCSPYYITFKFDSLIDIINYVSNCTSTGPKYMYNRYYHTNLNEFDAKKLISMLPMAKDINFKTDRCAIFETGPGGGCGIHKDGKDHRVSFNIPLEIFDDRCITNWYDDNQFIDMPYQGNLNYTRNVSPNISDLHKFTAIKSMVAKPNEMILFNTDIFHSWDNTKSDKSRRILTLRAKNYSTFYFDDAKKILFGL